MAVAYRAGNAGASGSSDTNVVNKPTGTVDDDIMVAQIYTEPVGQDVTAPSGWTALTARHDVAGTGYSMRAFWKRAASEGASYTFTATGNDWASSFLASYSGASTDADPFDGTGTWAQGADTSPAASAITTGAANSLVVQYIATVLVGFSQTTPPSGMTERFDSIWIVNDVTQVSAGSTGTKTATLAGIDQWSTFLFALKLATATTKAPVFRRRRTRFFTRPFCLMQPNQEDVSRYGQLR